MCFFGSKDVLENVLVLNWMEQGRDRAPRG